ncbi:MULTISPECIES: HNH endonuclease signature motif containing protein [Sphingobacterium]|uniref:HNH endonuclease signature motif containing protein n=1 Tax=Sphingobacterium TaxID=28453 RepID=UPI00257D6A87|nr:MULTISPECIES: HNH endonuclease signature motif containing protein [Sphingobacterium]
MATNKNKYGLSRHIPEEIQRQIRQQSGFGCVVCGVGLYEYEHIEPEFHDAEKHDPDCMTLLCPTCHGKVTKRSLSKSTVWKAKKNPITLRQGFSSSSFDFNTDESPFIVLGGTKVAARVPLTIEGVPILIFSPPVQENTPFLLSGVFFNDNGEKTLEIVDNEWKAFTENWDVTYEGNRITIKDNHNKKKLVLLLQPPDCIVVEYLEMKYGGFSVVIDPETLNINGNTFMGGMFSSSSHGIILGYQ